MWREYITTYPADPNAFVMLVISGFVFGFVFYRAMKQNKLPRLRRLAAVEAIEDGIKRTVELGKRVARALAIRALTTALKYFTFSIEHKGQVGGAARLGRYILMIGFGILFTMSGLTRAGWLVTGLRYLLFDWPAMLP